MTADLLKSRMKMGMFYCSNENHVLKSCAGIHSGIPGVVSVRKDSLGKGKQECHSAISKEALIVWGKLQGVSNRTK